MLTAILASLALSPAHAETAPEIKLRDLSNKERTLSAERGKVVLVNFWATWCAPCMVEMPHIQQMYTDLADIDGDGVQEFEVLSISIDDARDRSKIKPLVKTKGLTFPVLWDQNKQVSQVYNPSGVVPMTLIITQEGETALTVQEYAPGEECQLRAKVVELLGVPDPSMPEQCVTTP
ncbi:MAG: TlpA disulfide reductase family protein [Myxococcota bacterium]|nr:TlpA disulfide reductase family protein [Myxococcota bacterium]